MPFTVAATQYPDSGALPSPAYSGTFIPTLWSSKLIEKFYDTTVIPMMANTDYEGEIKSQGDNVKIRTRPTLTINNYQAGQTLAVQRPSSNIVDLLIDQGKYWNAIVDDVMETQSDINMMNIWAEDASEQMKIAIDTDILGNLAVDIDAQNQGATAGRITANIDLGVAAAGAGTSAVQLTDGINAAGQRDATNFIVDLNQVLDEMNMPEQGRYVIIPAWVGNLLKTGFLKSAHDTGDSVSVIRNGQIGMIDRSMVYVSNLLPKTGVEWTVYAGHQHGLTFASQIINTETIRAEQTFGNIMRGLNVYGYKVVDGTGLAMGIVKQ